MNSHPADRRFRLPQWYELPFLMGNFLGTWQPTDDLGWQWIWWQYAQADTRWWGTNAAMFALEPLAVNQRHHSLVRLAQIAQTHHH